MSAELLLRLLNASLGYLSIVLAVRQGGMLKEYALYLPITTLFSIAFDFGRSETVTRGRVSIASMRPIKQGFFQLLLLSLITLCFAPRITSAFGGALKEIFLVLAISGAMQAYIDVFLRAVMLHSARSMFVSVYQTICATLNLITIALSVRWVGSEKIAAWILAFLPSVVCCAYVLPTLAKASFGSDPRKAATMTERAIAALVKVLPSGIYAGQMAVIRALVPGYEVFARASFFIFGFFHIRLMARQTTGHPFVLSRFVVMFLATLCAGYPIFLAGSPEAAKRIANIGIAIPTCIVLALVWEVFLNRYKRYVDGASL